MFIFIVLCDFSTPLVSHSVSSLEMFIALSTGILAGPFSNILQVYMASKNGKRKEKVNVEVKRKKERFKGGY